jgi:hypothetical protein
MYVVNVFQGIASAVPILLLTLVQVFGQNPGTSVEIDLEEQTAYLLQNGRPVLATPISSGRYGHLTERGSFTILDNLPGYPASHGCVRMPEEYAIEFFNSVSVGTPVTVFGRTPVGRYSEQSRSTMLRRRNGFADPRFGPPFDPRFAPAFWWR